MKSKAFSKVKKALVSLVVLALTLQFYPQSTRYAYAAEGFPGIFVGAEVKIIADDSLTAKFDKRKDNSLKGLIGPNKWISVNTLSNYEVVYKDKIDQGKYKDGLAGAASNMFFSYSSTDELTDHNYSKSMEIVEQFLPADVQENDPILPIYEKITEDLKKEGEYIRETFKNADVASRKNAGFKKLPAVFVSEADATTEKIAGDSKKYGKVGKGVRIAAVMVDKPVEYATDKNTSTTWSIDLNNPITSDDLARHNIPENLTPLRTTGYEADLKKSLWLGYMLGADRRTGEVKPKVVQYEGQNMNGGENANINYRFEIKLVELKIPVKYEYLSQDASIDLPSDIKEKAAALNEEYGFGDKVSAKSVGDNVVTSTVDGSQWTFVGWMKDNAGSTSDSTNIEASKSFTANDYNDNNDANVNKFKGVWKRTGEPVPQKATVTYDFVDTDGQPAPQEIQNLKPENSTHELNEDVTASQPKDNTTEVKIGTHYWRFNGYKVNGAKTDTLTTTNGENKFVGEWEELYNVSYRFNGNDLPTALNDLLPQGKEKQANGTTVNAEAPKATTYTETKDGVKYLWTFNGWNDPTSVQINKADVEFVGTWSKEKLFNVTYEFKGIDASGDTLKEIPVPTEVNNNLPTDAKDYKAGEKATPVDPTPLTEVKDAAGNTWRFEGYKSDLDGEAVTELTIQDGDNKFIGYWKRIDTKVTYTFIDKDGGKLPEEIEKLIPPTTTHKLGETVNATDPDNSKVVVGNYTWKFNGYKDGKTPKTSLVTTEGENLFTGEWEKVYTVTYKSNYPGATPDPYEEVTEVSKNTSVGDRHPENPTRNKEGNKTYKFKKWNTKEDGSGEDFDSSTPITDNITVYAIWTESIPWTEVQPLYVAEFEFVSSDPNVALPEAVNALLPAVKRNLLNKAVVNADPIAKDPITEDLGDGKERIWTFKSWDEDTKTIDGANVKFVGTWEFKTKVPATPIVPLYSVNYTFESNDPDVDLPEEVKKLVPPTENSKLNGSEVSPAEVKTPTYEEELGEGKSRVWTFDGWDKDKVTIDGGDVTYTGTWSYKTRIPGTPIVPLYSVNYTFKSADPDVELPEEVKKLVPSKEYSKLNGSEVSPAEVKNPTYDEDLGEGKKRVWTFDGWDKDKVTVDGGDVTYTGTWSYKTIIPATPIEPDPENPANPDKPTPDKPANPDKPNPDKPAPQKPETPDNKAKAPKTGDDGFALELATLLAASVGLASLARRRKED